MTDTPVLEIYKLAPSSDYRLRAALISGVTPNRRVREVLEGDTQVEIENFLKLLGHSGYRVVKMKGVHS